MGVVWCDVWCVCLGVWVFCFGCLGEHRELHGYQALRYSDLAVTKNSGLPGFRRYGCLT